MGISAIILAAGLGKRMQGEKLHLKLHQTSIIDLVLETVGTVEFLEKLVVTNDQRIALKAASLGMKTIANKAAFLGLSTSIIQGIKAASIDTQGYLFIMGDQPLLSRETLEKILEAFRESPSSIIQPLYGTTTGSPVLFPVALKDELLVLQGDVGGKQVVKTHTELVRLVNIPSRMELMDVDTPEDYEILIRTGELNE